jgi:hypothetical protein
MGNPPKKEEDRKPTKTKKTGHRKSTKNRKSTKKRRQETRGATGSHPRPTNQEPKTPPIEK